MFFIFLSISFYFLHPYQTGLVHILNGQKSPKRWMYCSHTNAECCQIVIKASDGTHRVCRTLVSKWQDKPYQLLMVAWVKPWVANVASPFRLIVCSASFLFYTRWKKHIGGITELWLDAEQGPPFHYGWWLWMQVVWHDLCNNTSQTKPSALTDSFSSLIGEFLAKW